jgi:hypothetical protein
MMLDKRWVVELASADQLAAVPPSALEIATSVCSEGGKHLLVYRDNFTAFKVGISSGAKVKPARVVKSDTEPPGATRLGECEFLLLEPQRQARAA